MSPLDKQYKRKEMECNTLYEAEMFYIPYFRLENNKLVAVGDVPPKFSRLKRLTEEQHVIVDFKLGWYYTMHCIKSKQFYEDFLLDKIIFEDSLRII